MTHTDIQSALEEWILEPFKITDSGELELVATPEGSLVQPRDEYLQRYRLRLDSLRKMPSASGKLIADHERVVRILQELEPEEPLVYWEARTDKNLYAGVLSRLGMVSYHGPLPPGEEVDDA